MPDPEDIDYQTRPGLPHPAVAPETIEDTLEAKIAELLAPHRLARTGLVQALAALVGEAPARGPSPLRLQMLFEGLAPARAELINRWAFSFAIRGKESEGISESDLARILNVSRESINKRVREWRRIMGLPVRADHSAAIQSGHRTRKARGYTYRTPTNGRGEFKQSV